MSAGARINKKKVKSSHRTANSDDKAAGNKNTSNTYASTGSTGILSKKEGLGGLSPPQLTILIFLSIGVGQLVELNTAVKDGLYAKGCAKYFSDTKACTESDVFFIRAKYYSSIQTMLLTAIMALNCWTAPHLLQRLNRVLCMCPLFITIVGVLSAKKESAMNDGPVHHLAIMAAVLICVGISSNKVGAAPFRGITVGSVHDMGIWALIGVHVWEYFKYFFEGGTESYTTFGTDDITTGSEYVFKFIAVDKMAFALVMAFGLFYLDENRKRVMMFSTAILFMSQAHFQLPMLEDHLRGADYAEKFLVGSAILSGILAFLPNYKLV